MDDDWWRSTYNSSDERFVAQVVCRWPSRSGDPSMVATNRNRAVVGWGAMVDETATSETQEEECCCESKKDKGRARGRGGGRRGRGGRASIDVAPHAPDIPLADVAAAIDEAEGGAEASDSCGSGGRWDDSSGADEPVVHDRVSTDTDHDTGLLGVSNGSDDGDVGSVGGGSGFGSDFDVAASPDVPCPSPAVVEPVFEELISHISIGDGAPDLGDIPSEPAATLTVEEHPPIDVPLPDADGTGPYLFGRKKPKPERAGGRASGLSTMTQLSLRSTSSEAALPELL